MHDKLDKIDKRILYELDKNARVPDTKLAKIVNRSKESVRYRIKKLQEEKIIQGFTIWIDMAKLGYTSAKIYFNLANIPKERKTFSEKVKKDPRLFWLGFAEGPWNAGLTYFVKNNREFFELKNQLFSEFKDLILDSRTGMLVNVNVCDRTDLYKTETQWKTIFDTPTTHELDNVDKIVLKELFRNSRINVVDIARKNNTTVDIVRNRIKKLEENKIIFRYNTIINYNKLGHEFYKTFLYFKSLNKKDEARLMEYTRKEPKIIHMVKQITPWDIELEIMCESYQDYNKILSKLTEEFSDIIRKVETAIMSEDYIFPAKELIFEK